MPCVVYTIGHSTNSIERFVDLLRQHTITAVCDVRSTPYSRMNPQFSRETLKQSLASADLKYVFLGKELGARPADRDCYRNGQVQYEILANTAPFQEGIERIKRGAANYKIAMMCAEKEPLECHRTILVSRRLHEHGLAVKHILSDGQLEDHEHAMKRLVDILKIKTSDMFRSQQAVLDDAYSRQAHQIAYRENALEGTEPNEIDRKTARGIIS